MKLPRALLLIVLKQKKKHMQPEPRELLFTRAEAQSLAVTRDWFSFKQEGDRHHAYFMWAGPMFVPLGRWMEALRCALPVRHPVAFVSPRAAAEPRKEKSCSLRREEKSCSLRSPS